MPSTLDDIKRKHEEAMAIFQSAANGTRLRGLHGLSRAITQSIEQATDAFAELLAYHTKFKSAAGIAIDIERAKQ
jgi:hypothetical protein